MTVLRALLDEHLQRSGLFSSTELAVLHISVLPGGTNQVFLITAGKRQYVLKIPKPAARAFIDRQSEAHATTLTASAQISLEFCYFDAESGVNITPYQSGSHTLTPAQLQQTETRQAVAQIFQRLHQLPQKFSRDIELFALIRFYQQQAQRQLPPDLSGLLTWNDRLVQLQREFAAMPITLCPCHNDPMLGNFVQTTNQKIYLIDWEYAGNHDPYWDLATFCVEAKFTAAQEQQFLQFYSSEPLTAAELRRFTVYKTLSDYLWALWCVVMDDLDNARRRARKLVILDMKAN